MTLLGDLLTTQRIRPALHQFRRSPRQAASRYCCRWLAAVLACSKAELARPMVHELNDGRVGIWSQAGCRGRRACYPLLVPGVHDKVCLESPAALHQSRSRPLPLDVPSSEPHQHTTASAAAAASCIFDPKPNQKNGADPAEHHRQPRYSPCLACQPPYGLSSNP
jgi:hypothetical protein